jgi:glycosyltransferase involved in cell wall biosynthesis
LSIHAGDVVLQSHQCCYNCDMSLANPFPKVSVIIPAYRAATTIRRAVDSILRQTQPVWEVLIVDDGSPDDLSGKLSDYPSHVRLIRKPNGGAASARNLGVELAKGDLIAFLDADDFWETDKMHAQLEVFARDPRIQLCAGGFFVQLPCGARREGLQVPEEFYDRCLTLSGKDAFQVATYIWTSTVMVRREALPPSPFVSGLEPAEDGDLWIRLVLAGPFYLLSQPLATAVLEPLSLTRTSVNRTFEKLLHVIRRYGPILGHHAQRHWEGKVLRQWNTAAPLKSDQPGKVLGPAWNLLADE